VLLVAVFVLKAALLPLSFWLPHVYSAAAPPVAALFAILTKVGIAVLLRVSAIAFTAAPFTAGILSPWLLALALATVALGTAGALAAAHFVGVAANLVLISSGTLLAAVSLGGTATTAAALYYLPHSVLVTGGLFLLAGSLAGQRGEFADSIQKGPRLRSLNTLGIAFLILAVAASGVPPLSGFLGKIMLLQSAAGSASGWWFWAVLLASGLTASLVLARAASAFFWEPGRPAPASAVQTQPRGGPIAAGPAIALALLVAASPLLTIAAAPVAAYARAAAEQLFVRGSYIETVLMPSAKPPIERERRP
jgi:multicomponent K+:H+ antiporter subunit D